MENIESMLRHLESALYAMLAFLLCVVLLVSFVKLEPDTGCGVKTTEAFCGTGVSQPSSPQFQKGKDLFINNCASCHNKNMADNMTGPALGGVEARWATYPKGDLYQWIRSSQAMIKNGHPRATKLWREWNQTLMSDFSSLSDKDIEAILLYINR